MNRRMVILLCVVLVALIGTGAVLLFRWRGMEGIGTGRSKNSDTGILKEYEKKTGDAITKTSISGQKTQRYELLGNFAGNIESAA